MGIILSEEEIGEIVLFEGDRELKVKYLDSFHKFRVF
jgi:hypothetical protein